MKDVIVLPDGKEITCRKEVDVEKFTKKKRHPLGSKLFKGNGVKYYYSKIVGEDKGA